MPKYQSTNKEFTQAKSLILNTFDRKSPFNSLPDLPPEIDLESPEILRQAIQANRLLAELKGFCQTLPDPALLLNTIVLQESKESSAIENIVTTQDELYKAALSIGGKQTSPAAKEVIRYREAMYWALDHLKPNGLITTNTLAGIMQRIRNTSADVRTQTGTHLANPATGEIIYTPPDGEDLIRRKLASLENFINMPGEPGLDPLIKMALIHYQFEAIHPFTDGNGRTGRILNVLYLQQQGLLDQPVLYLSRFIIHHKSEYYRLLREVTENGQWKEWVIFMLNGIEETSRITLEKIRAILDLKKGMEETVKMFVSQAKGREIADLMFSYPYLKIQVLVEKGIAGRETASQYLHKLAGISLLTEVKKGRDIYFINQPLMNILIN